jgi:ribose transport system permease protein
MSATDSSARPSLEQGAAAPDAMIPEVPARRGPSRVLGWIEAYALPAIFLAVFLFFCFWPKTSKTFPTTTNIQNVLGNQGVIGLLALAIMIPLVCGEFDFSVGTIAGITQMLCAGFMARQGWPLLLVLVLVIAIGALIGLSTGNTVASIGVNSLIVTLGIASIGLGFVNWYSHGQSIISGISKTLVDIGSKTYLGIPGTLYILAIAALLIWYLLEHTPYGRYLHSIGSNREAARLVGLPVKRYVMLSFVLSGTLAGIAGVLLVARNGTANPQVGTVVETLLALSAAYLGSTAIRPGRFNVPGTLVAIFFLAFTLSGLQLAGVENWINSVFTGAALFIAVLISTVIGKRRAGVT